MQDSKPHLQSKRKPYLLVSGKQSLQDGGMSSFLWQRIRAARKWAKLTQQQVADQLGITREAISLWENASKGIHPELSRLQAFSRVTGAPLSWLVDDNADLEDAWLDRVNEIDAEPIPVAESATDSGYRVALLDAEAAMGDGVVNSDHPDVVRLMDFDPAFIRLLIGYLPPAGRLRLVTGRGDSMMPTIMPGDIVIVDTGCETFDGDGIYLINSGNGQQIKRLQDRGGVIHVFSDNPIYPAEPVNENTIIGGKVYLRNRLDRLG